MTSIAETAVEPLPGRMFFCHFLEQCMLSFVLVPVSSRDGVPLSSGPSPGLERDFGPLSNLQKCEHG